MTKIKQKVRIKKSQTKNPGISVRAFYSVYKILDLKSNFLF